MYLAEIETIDRPSLARLQSTRLADMMRRLRSLDVPFWADKLADVAEIADIADIEALPFTDKDVFRTTAAHLQERRLSMPDRDKALAVTGYRPGTITPLGAASDWPVVIDRRLLDGVVSIGVGEQGWSVEIDSVDLAALLEATVADVTAGS